MFLRLLIRAPLKSQAFSHKNETQAIGRVSFFDTKKARRAFKWRIRTEGPSFARRDSYQDRR